MTAPVIVGVDGSERSQDAVVLAADLAEPGSELLLVHVHPYDGLGDLLSGGEREQLVRDVSEPTAMTVLAALEPSTSRSMRLVSNRSPAAGLHEIAATVGAPLIVVGSGHRARRGRVSSGSVAESVLAGAPSPVAIASRGYGRTDRRLEAIGVGFDDSAESHDALRWAAARAPAPRPPRRPGRAHAAGLRWSLDDGRRRLPLGQRSAATAGLSRRHSRPCRPSLPKSRRDIDCWTGTRRCSLHGAVRSSISWCSAHVATVRSAPSCSAACRALWFARAVAPSWLFPAVRRFPGRRRRLTLTGQP